MLLNLSEVSVSITIGKKSLIGISFLSIIVVAIAFSLFFIPTGSSVTNPNFETVCWDERHSLTEHSMLCNKTNLAGSTQDESFDMLYNSNIPNFTVIYSTVYNWQNVEHVESCKLHEDTDGNRPNDCDWYPATDDCSVAWCELKWPSPNDLDNTTCELNLDLPRWLTCPDDNKIRKCNALYRAKRVDYAQCQYETFTDVVKSYYWYEWIKVPVDYTEYNNRYFKGNKLTYSAGETKTFKIEWKTPIYKLEDGWGSYGTWGTNPSNWWNTSYQYYWNMTAANSTYVDVNYTLIWEINASVGAMGDYYGVAIINSTADEVVFGFEDDGDTTIEVGENITLAVQAWVGSQPRGQNYSVYYECSGCSSGDAKNSSFNDVRYYFWDDFDGTTINTEYWDTVIGTGDVRQDEFLIIKGENDRSKDVARSLRNISPSNTGWKIDYNVNHTEGAVDSYAGIGAAPEYPVGAGMMLQLGYIENYVKEVYVTVATFDRSVANQWHNVTIYLNRTNGYVVYFNNSHIHSSTYTLPSDTLYYSVYEDSEFSIDDVFVRRYSEPEPSAFFTGSEETAAPPDTTPPLWNDTAGYLGSNTTTPKAGEAVKLYAMGYDETALDWAWLSTNESGIWRNYTYDFLSVTTLNDSSSDKNITFTTSENKTEYISLHKIANVTSAKLNLSGYLSDDLSVNKSSIINITKTQPWNTYQRAICKDSSGNLHVIFEYNVSAIYYAKSSDNGTSWSVNDSWYIGDGLGAVQREGTSISCSGQNISVVYNDFDNEYIYAALSVDNGATWVWKQVTSLWYTYDMNIERRGQNIYIVFDNNAPMYSQIAFIRSTDGGTTWGGETGIMSYHTLNGMKYSSFVVNGTGGPNDKLYVVATAIDSGEVYFTNSSDSGLNWKKNITIMSGLHSVITFDGTNLYIVTGDSNYDMYFTNSSDEGTTWETPYRIDTLGASANRARYPSITINDDRYPIVFWEQNESNTNYDIVYRIYNGTDWLPINGYYKITNDNNGNVFINTPYTYYNDNKTHFVWRNGTASPYNISYGYLSLSYPTNPYLDVGNDTTQEWNFTGEFSHTNNRTADFSSEINDFLSICSPDADGKCNVSLVLHSDTAGKIGISAIGIQYRMYNSPMDMSNAVAIWMWSNFTWKNSSVQDGTKVSWRVYYNDTSGNENVTSNQTFRITNETIVTISQGISATDAVSRTSSGQREISQNITHTDIISRISGFLKKLLQTINIKGIATRLAGFFRTLRQAINIRDVIGRIFRASKTIQEKISIVGIASRFYSLIRSVAESIEFTDAVGRIYGATRAISQAVNVKDATSRLSDFFRHLSQRLNISDIASRAYGAARKMAEIINISDILSKLMGFFRTLRQATIIETIGERVGVFYITITQTVSISDIASRLTGFYRTLSQSIRIESIVDIITGVSKKVSQVINIKDIATKLRTVPKKLQEAIKISDIASRVSSFFRIPQQSIKLADIVAKLRTVPRAILQTLNIKDAISRLYSMTREIAQTIRITDAVSRLTGLYKTLQQNITIADAAKRVQGFSRALSEAINIASIATRAVGFLRMLSQNVRIADSVATLYEKIRAISQAMNIGDVARRAVSFIRKVSQTINITDFASRIANFLRSIFELIKIAIGLKSIKMTFYDAIQYNVPNFTASGTEDIYMNITLQIDTTGADAYSGTVSRTLPTGVDAWTVYEGSGCTGTAQGSGVGNTATWTADQGANSVGYECICYEYTNGATLGALSWVQDTSVISNLTTQFIRTDFIVTESVGEAFNISWEISGTMPTGSTALKNVTNSSYPADGGASFNATAWFDKIADSPGTAVQGDAEITKKTKWTKSLYLVNNWDSSLTVNASISLVDCYTNITEDTYVVNPDGNNETIGNLTGMVVWNETLAASQSGTWNAHYYTPEIEVTRNETAVLGGVWYRYFDLGGQCVEIEDVKSYAPYDSDYPSLRLYDDSLGAMTDVTVDADYAFAYANLQANWTVPNLYTTGNSFVIKGFAVQCTLVSKEILNPPIKTNQNVQWEQLVKCTNLKLTYTEYTIKWRMPFDARLIKVNATEKERSFDAYGAYINLKGALGVGESEYHSIEYVTDAVTADLTYSYPEDREEKWLVDEDNPIIVTIDIKSWSEDDINETISKQISLYTGYGENLKLFYLGEEVDTQSYAVGIYDFKIESIGGDESREYTLNYTVVPATSEKILERPEPQTGLIASIYKITGTLSMTVPELWFEPDIDYNITDRAENFDTGEAFGFEKADEETVSINLGAFAPAEVKTVSVFHGLKGGVPERPKIIEEFLEWMNEEIYLPLISDITALKYKRWEVIVVFGGSGFIIITLVYYYLRKIGILKWKIPIPKIRLRKKKEEKEEAEVFTYE